MRKSKERDGMLESKEEDEQEQREGLWRWKRKMRRSKEVGGGDDG